MTVPDFSHWIGLSWDRIEITMSCRLSGQKARIHIVVHSTLYQFLCPPTGTLTWGSKWQEAVIFVAILKSLWPSSSFSPSVHCQPHCVVCNPGGDPWWGEIKWGVQSFFFCCSFYSWPDNQSTGAQGLCSALCHCPSLPISMVSTQTQCWLTDHNVFSCVYVTSVPLCCWQILPFQIGGEIMVYNPRSNTQWPAVSQRYTHTTDSIRLWWWSEENWPNYYY